MPDLPVNEQAERSVLGACIDSGNLFTSVLTEGVTADDFSVSNFQRIFRALMEMRQRKLPIDCISVAEHLGNSQSDFALVSDLISSGAVFHPKHVAHYCRIIRQKSRLRSLLRLSDWMAREAGSPCADPDEIIKRACDKLGPASVTI